VADIQRVAGHPGTGAPQPNPSHNDSQRQDAQRDPLHRNQPPGRVVERNGRRFDGSDKQDRRREQ
jgi:hypothetical protein